MHLGVAQLKPPRDTFSQLPQERLDEPLLLSRLTWKRPAVTSIQNKGPIALEPNDLLTNQTMINQINKVNQHLLRTQDLYLLASPCHCRE